MRRAIAPLLVRGGQPGAAVELAWCSAIYSGELQNTPCFVARLDNLRSTTQALPPRPAGRTNIFFLRGATASNRSTNVQPLVKH